MAHATQFTNLKTFVPRSPSSRAPPRTPQSKSPRHISRSILELLRGAELVQPSRRSPDGPVQDLDDAREVPPASEWHLHPDLLQGCEPGSGRPLRVAMLLSGGVDSSLALRLLRAAGHEVTAFYLQIWFQEDFRNFWDSCPWEEDLRYCREVCAQLDVPLEVVPLTRQYWDRVVAHSISEIRQGRTPNPDILCNSRVKFGAFYEHLEHRHGPGFDRVASGHYARLERPPVAESARGTEPDGGQGVPSAGPAARLALTPDAVKDQTYFLAHLRPAQLQRTMFPLGHLTKEQVRRLAAAAHLPNQARKDSQGICFLGKVKFSEFVREHLGEWPGPLIEEESGEVVGYHRGFWFHTVGQRKGVPLSGGPWYVTRKDPHTNVVYISRQYYQQDKVRNAFSCSRFNWIGGGPQGGLGEGQLYCKVRHGPHMYPCTLKVADCGTQGYVQLEGNDQGLAAGQYAVFYRGAYCLGSAVISSTD